MRSCHSHSLDFGSLEATCRRPDGHVHIDASPLDDGTKFGRRSRIQIVLTSLSILLFVYFDGVASNKTLERKPIN